MRATTLMIAMGLAAFASLASAAEPVSGETVWKRWCVHCHSTGRGNPGTESLTVKYRGSNPPKPAALLDRTDLSPEMITFFVRQGVLSMPPFRKTEVTDAELAALATYMSSKYVKP